MDPSWDRNINLIFQELSQSLRSLCQRTSCHSKMSPSSNVDVSRFSIVSRPFSVGTRKRHCSPLKTSRKPEMLMLIGQEPSSDCFKFQTKIHHSTMTTRIIISNPENEWTWHEITISRKKWQRNRYRYRYRKYQETQPEVYAKVSMGPKHPFCTQAPHLRASDLVFGPTFTSQLPTDYLITSKCEVSLHHALHHAYHASYWIILDHRKTSVDSPRVPKANKGRLHTTQITSDLAALEPVRASLQDSPGTLSETPSSFHVA